MLHDKSISTIFSYSTPGLSVGSHTADYSPTLARDLVLDVQHLTVNFKVHGGEVKAVRDVSFQVRRGETLCIVGESGSGKSVTVQALMGILPVPPAKIMSGMAILEGKRDILTMNTKDLRKVLGVEIAMIFQDPLASLNPTMTVKKQIEETLILHTKLNAKQREDRVLELLDLVRIPEAKQRLHQYPHELSGGMRQRVMIAMALACNPKILIADEPTTALDVTIQAQILALIKEISQKLQMATILITHDLGVVANMADRVVVMYAGKIVEEGTVDDIFYRSKHPYTQGLKLAMPAENGASKRSLQPIRGTPPDLFHPPQGCAFASRCNHAMAICHMRQAPELKRDDARISCWLQAPQAENQRIAAGLFPL